MAYDVCQHIMYMVEFSFSVSVKVVDSIIDQPELVDSGVNLNISYNANAFDNSLGVSTVLVAHSIQFLGLGKDTKRPSAVLHTLEINYSCACAPCI